MTWDENLVRAQIREVLKKRSTVEFFFKTLQDQYRDSYVQANAGLELMDSEVVRQLTNQNPDFKPIMNMIKGFGEFTRRTFNDFRFVHCILEELALSRLDPQRQDVISEEDRKALDLLKKNISSPDTEMYR